MYKLKKIFALFLAIVLATSFSTVAFAAEEESGIPENATKHTIELTVEPGETLEDDAIAPYMWGQGTYSPPVGGVTYTPTFTVDNRYFAYEVTAIGSSGNAVSGTATIKLLYHASMGAHASLVVDANGVTEKLDWIDVYTGSAYLFKIFNSTGTSINVTITYYTWA